MKERDDLAKKFEGIDPDAVRQLADDKRKLEEAQQIKAGEVEKVFEARLKNARAEWDSQGEAQIRVFQGRRVIVDDGCPYTSRASDAGEVWLANQRQERRGAADARLSACRTGQ